MTTHHLVRGFLLAAIPSLFIGSSALAQQDARAVVPATTLEISKGYEFGAGLGHSAGQTYYFAVGAGCAQWKRAGFLTWITPEAKTLPIEPGRAMVVFSETARATSGYRYLQTSTCWGASSFTPVAGHQYRARFIAPRDGRCYMQVEDGQTNAPVATQLRVGPGLCTPPDGSEASRYLRDDARRNASTGSHSRDLYASSQPPTSAQPFSPSPGAPVTGRPRFFSTEMLAAALSGAIGPLAAPPPLSPAQMWGGAGSFPVQVRTVRTVAAVAPPAPAASPQPPESWRVSVANPPAVLASWNATSPAAPPSASEAGRVTTLRVNADGSVSETRER